MKRKQTDLILNIWYLFLSSPYWFASLTDKGVFFLTADSGVITRSRVADQHTISIGQIRIWIAVYYQRFAISPGESMNVIFVISSYPELYTMIWKQDIMGRVKRNEVLEHAQNAPIQIHLSHAQNIIRAFAPHLSIILCQMILLADTEGPDQPARMRRMRSCVAWCDTCPQHSCTLTGRPYWFRFDFLIVICIRIWDTGIMSLIKMGFPKVVGKKFDKCNWNTQY